MTDGLLMSFGWVLVIVLILLGASVSTAHLRLWFWRRKIRRALNREGK